MFPEGFRAGGCGILGGQVGVGWEAWGGGLGGPRAGFGPLGALGVGFASRGYDSVDLAMAMALAEEGIRPETLCGWIREEGAWYSGFRGVDGRVWGRERAGWGDALQPVGFFRDCGEGGGKCGHFLTGGEGWPILLLRSS